MAEMMQSAQICPLCQKPEGPFVTPANDRRILFAKYVAAATNYPVDGLGQFASKVCEGCNNVINGFYTLLETILKNNFVLFTPNNGGNGSELCVDPEQSLQKEDAPGTMHVDEVGIQENDPSAEGKSAEESEEPPASCLPIEDEDEDDRLLREYFGHKCHLCQRSFTSSKELIRHTKINHNTTPTWHCCGINFTTRSRTLRHIKSHVKPVKCNECGRGFRDKTDLETHKMYRHSQEKQFKCDKCRWSFEKEGQLQRHLRRHDPVVCNICNKGYANKYFLNRHIKSQHSDKRNFFCDLCGLLFKSSSSLYEHRKYKHTAAKRKVYCHKMIPKDGNLSSHMKGHRQKKAHVTCEICSEEFTNDRSLKLHKKKVHDAQTRGKRSEPKDQDDAMCEE